MSMKSVELKPGLVRIKYYNIKTKSHYKGFVAQLELNSDGTRFLFADGEYAKCVKVAFSRMGLKDLQKQIAKVLKKTPKERKVK